ncbi:unnamed protein product [Oikopleura dioica]|uniref:Uncharacterized protein n=1 Tax=Oikopleura dioica TaxID=34765 RepID=E4XE83_OIKDI|nr:unnamed protein product [Oikopleura dioica]
MPFKIALDESKVFKNAIASLQNIITSGIFYVTPAGLEFTSLCASHICMIEINMPAAMFSCYETTKTYALGGGAKTTATFRKLGEKRPDSSNKQSCPACTPPKLSKSCIPREQEGSTGTCAKAVRIASSKTGSSAFSETTNSATETKTIRPRTFSPAIIVRDRTCFHQLTKILRPKLTNNANQHTNRNNQNNYGSVETLSSFSSQSGSYHLPSSANFSTLPDRSLAESPHALHIDSDLEKYSEESEDELYIRTIPQTPPLTVPVAYASNDEPPSSPETGKKNLLWSNPAPFGSQPLQKVIRSVQAPIQKPQNLHWPPLERKKPDSSNRTPPRPPPLPLRPPQLTHQLEKQVLDVQEISVLPLRLSPRERPRSAVQDRVYKDILFDNTERTSSPIKSGLSKTLRPSIEDLVSILAEPIPPHNRKSHRRSLHEQSEEILINELKTEKKPRPGILKNSNTTSSSRVVEVLYHEPRSRKTDQERMRRAEHPPIFLGEDDFGNNWIDLTQPARTPYLNDY